MKRNQQRKLRKSGQRETRRMWSGLWKFSSNWSTLFSKRGHKFISWECERGRRSQRSDETEGMTGFLGEWKDRNTRITLRFLNSIKGPPEISEYEFKVKAVMMLTFSSTYTKIRTTQRRFACPLYKDSKQICEVFHMLCSAPASSEPLLINTHVQN